MCGIVGIISPNPADLSPISAMMARVRHRGPDGEGLLIIDPQGTAACSLGGAIASAPKQGRAAFGHTRLAIIDTSERGLQPMGYADGRYWIMHNGEVYNYRELRAELEKLGHRFVTQTDTEVIVAAYGAWGTACFAKFNGMWALAIYDTRERTLVLSRDRFGIKPLYYGTHDGKLFFASEITPLLPHIPASAAAATQPVLEFLRTGYLSHASETFFSGILHFPAAHHATIRLDAPTNMAPQRYWQPPTATYIGSFADASAEFRTRFMRAIELHLRADVPVGTCLSGGLDSASIVAGMRALEPKREIHSFTAGSTAKRFDERDWAAKVAAASGTIPHETLTHAEDFLAELDALLDAQEEPFAGAGIFAQWQVMKMAQDAQLKVLLDGQGADEVLCGYLKYVYRFGFEKISTGQWGAAISHFARAFAVGDQGLRRLSRMERYLPSWLAPKGQRLKDCFTAAMASRAQLAPPPKHNGGTVSAWQHDDVERLSLPVLLRYEDKNSMHFGIESRVPFLDAELADFCLSLPAEYKLHGGRTKGVLREGLRGITLPAVLDRRTKMGFETAQIVWTQGGVFRDFLIRTMSAPDARVRSLVDADCALALLNTKGVQQEENFAAFFRLAMLERWSQRFNVTLQPA